MQHLAGNEYKIQTGAQQTSFNEVTVLKSSLARKLGDETINALSARCRERWRAPDKKAQD